MNNKCCDSYNENLLALLGIIAEQKVELDKIRPRIKDLEYANCKLKEMYAAREQEETGEIGENKND